MFEIQTKNKEKIGRKAEDKMEEHELAKGSDKDGGTASRMQRHKIKGKLKIEFSRVSSRESVIMVLGPGIGS